MKKIFLILLITTRVYAGLDAKDGKVVNVATPTLDSDATTKEYVDDLLIYSFGDGGIADYTDFNDFGSMIMYGDARVTKYAWMPAGAIRGVGAAPASETLNPTGFIILEFADAADDYAQSNINIPNDMDLSADSYICIAWSVPNTAANMTWGYGYLITAPNDDTEAAATTGTQVVTSSAVADGLNNSTIITIAGGTIGATDICIHLYIYRDVSADTYGNPVDLHGMAFEYTANKLGEPHPLELMLFEDGDVMLFENGDRMVYE